MSVSLDHALSLSLDRYLSHSLDISSSLSLDRTLSLIQDFSRINIFSSINFSELIAQLENLRPSLPENEADIQQKRAFRETLFSLWLNALEIAVEDVQGTWDYLNPLTDYFYICELMVRCKESAVRVSPDLWARIESHILTVPTQ